MMDALLTLWNSALWLYVLALGPVLVMVMAAAGRTVLPHKTDLHPDESALDHLQVQHRLSRRKLTLTTHRLVLQDVRWWLVRSREVSLPLDDLSGAQLLHRVNPFIFVTALLGFPVVAPLAVLWLLYGFVKTQFALAFGAQHHVLGRSWKLRFATPRHSKPEEDEAVFSFYRAVQRQHGIRTGRPTGGTPLSQPALAGHLTICNRETWVSVALLLGVALLQRALQAGIDLDNPVFLALYAGVPVAVGARHGWRDGFIAGFFGAFALVSALHPSPGLGAGSAGASASVLAYTTLAGVMSLLGVTAGTRAPANRVCALLAVPMLGWVGVAMAAGATSAGTVGQWSAIALAYVGVCAAYALAQPEGPGAAGADADEVELEPEG